MLSIIIYLAGLLATATAGPVLWDGRMNGWTSSASLDNWSLDNMLPPYQWYLHGTGATSEYVTLSSAYKNPADSVSLRGARLTIDASSHYWNTPEFQTALVPQPYNMSHVTINEGKLFYHFSVRLESADPTKAHTLFSFPHMWTGMAWTGNQLSWLAANESRWSTSFASGTWHNFAYEIDFSAGSVALFHSIAGAALGQVAGPFAAAATSDGVDWVVGVVRAANPNDDLTDCQTEEWDVSGVYIEQGPLTTSVSGPGYVSKRELGSAVLVESPRQTLRFTA